MNEEEIAKAISLPVSDEDEENLGSQNQSKLSPESPDLTNLSPELLSAFKLVDSLMNSGNRLANQPFLNPVDANGKNHRNYYLVIKRPMWLKKIYEKLLSEAYTSITEVVSDLRLVLENCYRYFTRNHPTVKKAIKLETILEQKIALLPSNLRERTTLELTNPRLAELYQQLQDHNQQQGATHPGLTGTKGNSVILQCVREERAQKERERKREQMEERKAEREAAHQETLHWEEALLAEHASDIRKMWELPQIGHFLYLAQKTLNLPEVSQYELERSLFMPSGSSLMAAIMTSLLSSPHQRTKLDQWPSMRHKTWESRLKVRVQHWYKVYTNKERNLLKVFELIGIEPEFFRIMGDANPMEEKMFQELNLRQRIWVLKSLCDYCLHNHKTVQDAIMEVNYDDQREAFLGEDKEGNQYVHFPQFCGQSLRIYRMTKDTQVPELDLTTPIPAVVSDPVVKTETPEEANKEENEKPPPKTNHQRKRKGKHKNSRNKRVDGKPAKPLPPTFELVVESVEALRNLMDCFVELVPKNNRRQANKNKGNNSGGQPPCEKHLHNRLKNLLGELEPWEQKLEQAIIKSRLKLKKEWEDRKLKDVHQDEETDEFWGMETEEEIPQVETQVDVSSSSDNFSDFVEDPNASEFRQTHRRTCTRRKRVWESDASSSDNELEPFKITVSSRGRVCKMRNFNYVPLADKVPVQPTGNTTVPPVKKVPKTTTTTKPTTVILNGILSKQRDMLEAHRSQNSATDAQIQYQWETMRLKLLKETSADKSTPAGKSESDESPQVSFVAKTHKPLDDEDVLDRDVYLSAGPDFGSWKSSVPGSAFAEQTFTTLLEKVPSFTPPSQTTVVPKPPPQKKVEIVRLSLPQAGSNKATPIFYSPEKPKPGIFRDKNVAGGDRRFVKTTFTAPGILRSTISKRPAPVEPAKPCYQPSAVKQTLTSNSVTNATVIPSLARPGQKILVLPIKDASGNKVLLQVLPKGSQPLKLSQFRGANSVVNRGLTETKFVLPNNIGNRICIKQQPTKTILCNQNQQVLSNQNLQHIVTNQNRQILSNQSNELVASDGQHFLSNQTQHLSNQNQALMAGSQSHELVSIENQQLMQDQNHSVSAIQDPLYHAVTTQILQSPMSQELSNHMLQNSELTAQHTLQTPVSQDLTGTNTVLHNTMTQELTTNQILHTPVSQDMVTSRILHTPVTSPLLHSQDFGTSQLLHSPPHEHFSPQNMSPPTNQLLATPTDHSQLIHSLQSSNTAQLLANSLNQNQVLQTSPNQILTSVSPVLTHPDGTMTLLTQGSTSTMVLPVQTLNYAPQLYASSEPKMIVCTNGQVLDGNMTQDSLFVMTSNGQLVSMENCTFQQAVLTEQMSPL